jgi:ribulose-phosphate 3-epimerase
MQKVVPAILTPDPLELSRQLSVLKNQTKWVHIDIMDGNFVPNTSISISELGEAGQFFNLELHLMVQDPEKYFEDCKEIGAKRVYFHWEGTKDPEHVLSVASQYSFYKGIAINPETKVQDIVPYLSKVDSALVMSVVPGAQGHEFIPSVLEKVQEFKKQSGLVVGVDGGVGKETIQNIFAANADYVAVGSGIWQAEDSLGALRSLQLLVK